MKIKEITAEHILFNDGTEITYYHGQDCCENVFAEFEALKDTAIWDEDFKKLEIKGVKEYGFNLNGYGVPCYDQQNGYYSNQLDIVIDYPNGKKETIDVTEYLIEEID